MTLKDLVISYDAYLIDSWWHTAFINTQLYNLQATVTNALGAKRKMRPKSVSEFHPFVAKTPVGKRTLKGRPADMSFLKAMGNALCR